MKYLTLAEVADRLRISRKTLYNRRWRENGGPKWVREGNRVLYPLAEVEAYERALGPTYRRRVA